MTPDRDIIAGTLQEQLSYIEKRVRDLDRLLGLAELAPGADGLSDQFDTMRRAAEALHTQVRIASQNLKSS